MILFQAICGRCDWRLNLDDVRDLAGLAEHHLQEHHRGTVMLLMEFQPDAPGFCRVHDLDYDDYCPECLGEGENLSQRCADEEAEAAHLRRFEGLDSEAAMAQAERFGEEYMAQFGEDAYFD